MGDMIQNIFDQFQQYLPEDWDRVMFYVNYNKGNKQMNYFVLDSDGSLKSAIETGSITSTELNDVFLKIGNITDRRRIGLDDKYKWTVFILSILNNGRVSIKFQYDEIGYIEDDKEWIKKYI